MKITKLLILSAFVFSLAACGPTGSGGSGYGDLVIEDFNPDKPVNGDQFDFDGNYTPPELTIDGLKNEEQWNNASQTLTFGSTNQTTMQIYRGKDALFCFFSVKDPDIETVGNNNGDDVTHGDSVEVYFDFKNDGSSKPASDDIQLNIGAHGKTRIFVGSNGQWGSWNGLLDYEIHLLGTLNDPTDVDEGYNIEVMIPYSQVGIEQNSVYGVACGHVARGTDSTNPDLQYTWGGLVYEGSFVDPQVPRSYIVFMGNKFYQRNNMPIGNIDIEGKIVDQFANPIKDVEIKVGEETYTTNSNGQYSIPAIKADNGLTFNISKDGYKTYEKSYSVSELKTESGRKTLNFVLINETQNAEVTLNGVVKNPATGTVGGALISIGNKEVYSKDDGSFSIAASIDNDLELTISKDLYKSSSTKLDALDLIGKTNIEIGTVSLYSPSSFTTFGGARGIPAVTAEIFRGFEGINFVFTSSTNITGGSHVEMFVDSKTSYHGRDATDYRIDFTGEGNIAIVNFGNGTNTIVSTSGITNNAYLEGSTYYMETLLPYSFLGVEPTDIIGVSFGVFNHSTNDWDGWNFKGEGFADYVAPEYTDQYCRIGLDNGLYRSLSNNAEVTRVYGRVLDKDNNPITTAFINSHAVSSDGSYSLYLENGKDINLTVTATGYVQQTISISGSKLNGTAIEQNFTLAKAEAVIKGTINVDGVKIYLQADPSIIVFSQNGTYEITVPTTANARIVFEKEGYTTQNKAFSVVALQASANENTPITYNVVMVQA